MIILKNKITNQGGHYGFRFGGKIRNRQQIRKKRG